MKVLDSSTQKNVLTATLLVEAREFASALERAYQANKEKYLIPDRYDGTAPRSELERAFGPKVLYEEALDLCVPEACEAFLRGHGAAPIAPPETCDLGWPEGGGVAFTVRATLLPTVSAGRYGDLAEAAASLEIEVPEPLIERKLDAMVAQEKIRVNQDPVYNLLADVVEILDRAYHAVGIKRSEAQVRSEAMDIMLRSVSRDQEDLSRESFFRLVGETVGAYCELPEGFGATLAEITEGRKRDTGAMPPEKRAEGAFAAYLGSLELGEETWRAQRRAEAEGLAKQDLFLDAVSEAEGLAVGAEELEAAYRRIAEDCGMDIAQVKAAVDPTSLEWQLRRDKARRLVLHG